MFNEVFIGDIFGLIIALPISLFLAFWISAIKNRFAAIAGAFIGALIGFIAILAWVGNLISTPPPMPGASGVAVFFSAALLCSITGLVGGIVVDLLVAAKSSRDYRQQTAHE